MFESRVKTREGNEKVTAYTWDEAPLFPMPFETVYRNHQNKEYAKIFGTLDTETSHKDDVCGWIYQWAIFFNGVFIYGRKPSEIISFFDRIIEHYELSDDRKIIFYVHNLAYDFQYLKAFLKRFDASLKVFAIDNHTVLFCDLIGIRLICSYKLTNLSLDALAKNYSAKYVKATGEIDYTITRYQDTQLTETDWHYMFSDVASQHDGIRGYLTAQGYHTPATAPITSTGFVRVDCRKASEKVDTWHDRFTESALDIEQYKILRQAFMGGITIASYLYEGETLRGDNLRHVDFTSSYPARQMLDYFPQGAPSYYGDIEDKDELKDLLDNYCCVFRLRAENVQIKQGVTAPYIPSSKCVWLKNELKINGKVVYADELEMYVCEIDYKWIKKQYDAENVYISDLVTFERGRIPEWMKEKIMQYYQGKCELKHKDELLYMKLKNFLNGIYGMTATAIIRETYELGDDLCLSKKQNDGEKQLKKFYANRNSFLPYQYAIYTTAHARDALMRMIECVGYENFLYCDTDSVFYLETDENKIKMDTLKKELIARAQEGGAFIGNNYLGAAEDEPQITAFRALHAKCYAMIEEGELKVTIAGIPKKSIKWIDGNPVARTNADELGDIDNLKDGFVFRHCGGTRTVYVEHDINIEDIDNHPTEYASAAIILNIEKEISQTMWTRGKDYSLLHIQQKQL